jgi:hypothetical protein
MGNFISIQHEGNTQQDQPNTSGAKVFEGAEGVMTVNADGSVSVDKGSTHTPTQDNRSAHSGILSTLKTASGTPQNDLSRVTDKSIVTVDGIEMSVKGAIAMGLLNRDAQGNLKETPASVLQKGQDKQSEPLKQSPVADLRSEGLRQVSTLMTQALGSKDAADNLMLRIISNGAVAKNGDALVTEMASALGIEPERALKRCNGILDTVQQSLSQTITRAYGMDGDSIVDWLTGTADKKVAADVLQRAYLGDRSVIDNLIRKYKANDRQRD